MALSLECGCGPGVFICETVSLKWRILSVEIDDDAGPVTLSLIGPSTINRGAGYTTLAVEDIDLTPVDDWIAAWDTLQVNFTGQRSTASDALANVRVGYEFMVTYSCSDGISTLDSQDMIIRGLTGTIDVCADEMDLTIQAFGEITPAGVNGWFRHTRPLNPCFGWDVTGPLDLFWTPTSLHTVDVSQSTAPRCLCPSGGEPPYIYTITKGNLPGGVTLDSLTGCLSGSVDNTAHGSDTITFMVQDGAHHFAEVTCLLSFCAGHEADAMSNILY